MRHLDQSVALDVHLAYAEQLLAEWRNDAVRRRPMNIKDVIEQMEKYHGPIAGLHTIKNFHWISEEELDRKRLDASQAIFALREELKSLLERHGEEICKIWKKSKRNKRCKIVNEAWCDQISSGHRPDIAHLLDGNAALSAPSTGDDERWIAFPHINQTDLVEGDNLLLFMRTRATLLPSELIFNDLSANGACWGDPDRHFVAIPGRSYGTARFIGTTMAETYCEIHFEQDDAPASRENLGEDHVVYWEGISGILNQECVYRGLFEAAQAILQRAKQPIMEPPDLISHAPCSISELPISESDANWEEAAVSSLYNPLRTPFFPLILQWVADAKHRICKDIQGKRSDSKLFLEQVFSVQRRNGSASSTAGVSALAHNLNDDTRSVAAKMISDHFDLAILSRLQQLVTDLGSYEERGLYDPINLTGPESQDCIHALSSFRARASVHFKAAIRNFVRKGRDLDTRGWIEAQKASAAAPKWCRLAHALAIHGLTDGITQAIGLADLLHRTVKASDDHVKKTLLQATNTLALIGECIRQVNCFEPWAGLLYHFEAEIVDGRPRKDRMIADERARMDALYSWLPEAGDSLWQSLSDLIRLNPHHSRRLTLVERQDKLREAWRSFDEILRAKMTTGKGLVPYEELMEDLKGDPRTSVLPSPASLCPDLPAPSKVRDTFATAQKTCRGEEKNCRASILLQHRDKKQKVKTRPNSE